MKTSQIKRILEGLGYEIDQVVQIPEIRALISGSNQGINYHEDFLKFKSSGIISIKRYKYKPVSGRLSNMVIFNGKNILSSQSNLYIRHNFYPFRAPKIGDTVFFIDNSGKIISEKSKIIAIANKQITLDNDISSYRKNDTQIVYTDTELFDSSVQDKRTPALFFKYNEITKYTSDIYLDLSQLIGIEMHSGKIGAI